MFHSAYFINNAQRLRTLHFRFSPMVWHQCSQVTHQMPIPMVYSASGKHQNTLLVYPLCLWNGWKITSQSHCFQMYTENKIITFFGIGSSDFLVFGSGTSTSSGCSACLLAFRFCALIFAIVFVYCWFTCVFNEICIWYTKLSKVPSTWWIDSFDGCVQCAAQHTSERTQRIFYQMLCWYDVIQINNEVTRTWDCQTN